MVARSEWGASAFSPSRLVSIVIAAVVGAALASGLIVVLGLAQPGERAMPESEGTVERVYRQAFPGVVVVVDRSRLGESLFKRTLGSGFVVDGRGYVLTNEHVIAGVRDPGIVLGDEEDVVPAVVVGKDAIHDLAVLKVDLGSEPLHALRLGDSSRVRPGQTVVAIGSPYGLGRSVTAGVVSYVGRPMGIRGGAGIEKAIQTDAALNPGNSGGPLLNLDGEVIGITTTAILKDIGDFQVGSVGVGFAIPSEVARGLLPEMTSGGLRTKPWLGVVLRDLVEPGSEQGASESGEGAMVLYALPGGGAEEAGVRGASFDDMRGGWATAEGGDVISAIDGVKVRSVGDLAAYLADSGAQVSDVVRLEIVRAGQALEVAVRLRARDDSQPGAI